MKTKTFKLRTERGERPLRGGGFTKCNDLTLPLTNHVTLAQKLGRAVANLMETYGATSAATRRESLEDLLIRTLVPGQAWHMKHRAPPIDPQQESFRTEVTYTQGEKILSYQEWRTTQTLLPSSRTPEP